MPKIQRGKKHKHSNTHNITKFQMPKWHLFFCYSQRETRNLSFPIILSYRIAITGGDFAYMAKSLSCSLMLVHFKWLFIGLIVQKNQKILELVETQRISSLSLTLSLPLSSIFLSFSGDYLTELSRACSLPPKSFIKFTHFRKPRGLKLCVDFSKKQTNETKENERQSKWKI